MFGGMTGTESKWMGRVRDWKRSGQSAKEFSESQPYQPSSLIWWERRLRSRLVAAKRPVRKGADLRSRDCGTTVTVPMVRVMRSAAAQSDAKGVVVEIGSARVVVQAGFDAGLLNAVVRALQGAP